VGYRAWLPICGLRVHRSVCRGSVFEDVLHAPSANDRMGCGGLLGTSIFVANGVITNGIEMLAFLNTDLLSKQQELFWLLFRLTRVL
jgi:hypothetical protein